MVSRRQIAAFLRRHWFLLGLVGAITAAKVAPWIGKNGGILMPERTLKWGAVPMIFFNSGLTLKTEDLKAAVLQVKLHIAIQGYTLFAVPLLLKALVIFLQNTTIDRALLKGLLVLGCMPPPVSSAVILTKAAGGNEAAAIFNSAFGSFLGIFVTPTLLMTLVGLSADVPVANIFTTLSTTVVLPLLIGQVIRFFAWTRISKWNIPFGNISSCVLLLIIFATFCNTFSEDIDIDTFSLGAILCIDALIIVISSATLFASTIAAGFRPKDVVCAVFCGVHKSLTLGIPMLNIIFAGSPELTFVTLPLLAYHPMQILLGGLSVPWIASWLTNREFKKSPAVVQRRHARGSSSSSVSTA